MDLFCLNSYPSKLRSPVEVREAWIHQGYQETSGFLLHRFYTHVHGGNANKFQSHQKKTPKRSKTAMSSQRLMLQVAPQRGDEPLKSTDLLKFLDGNLTYVWSVCQK
jgi:hypothetical protein